METTASKTQLGSLQKHNEPTPPPDHTINVYFWLIICSVMMFTLPFATFFSVKHVLHEYHIDGFENNCWSTIAAVIVVNLIIGFYAYLGYLEDKHDHPDNGKDKKKK